MAASLPLPLTVGERIKYARRFLQGWSQAELSRRTEAAGYLVTEPQIQRIENGQRPDIGQLTSLATALGVTLYQLGAEEESFPEIILFKSMGWNPEVLPDQSRWNGKRPRHLRLLTPAPT
jgi:transcriptional regulator with XRE-family HTH domain